MIALSQTGQSPRRIYRFIVPAAALCAFAVVAALWGIGRESLAFTVFRALGVEPGPVPFIDMQAVLAAAECHWRGIDVYVSNPCDLYGRLHVYSPLWLAIVPPGIGAAATPWVGAAVDLLVVLSLPLLLRPRRSGELLLFAAAVFSPMTLYALERANNDLIVLLLVLAVGLLQEATSRRWRFCGYAVLTGAALLKYYPAILFALAARERRRDAIVVIAGAAAVLGIFVLCYRGELARALALIPASSYYTDSFSAKNLPFGLISGMRGLATPLPYAVALFAMMLALAFVWLRRAALLLDAAGLDWTGRETRFATIGALLLVGCFFTAHNVDYRGVFFLLVLPGLVFLRGVAPRGAARSYLTRLVAAILFLMWGEFLRRGILTAFHAEPSDRVAMLFWIVRELIWWWVVAGLGAIAFCYVKALPLSQELLARLGLGYSLTPAGVSSAASGEAAIGRSAASRNEVPGTR